MALEVLQQYLGRLCNLAVLPEDAVLLKRFAEANDRDAFAQLIARHGPMVLGTARRLVDRSHDAEDVFQAVFLSLARLAKSIRNGRTLAAWLHRTTCRVAARIRASQLPKSKAVADSMENRDPSDGLQWREVRQTLDEELQRLPERLRSPLLLCYLSGLTRDEAAKQLGLSLGTLKRRLEEGRNTLRIRLARRGIAAVSLALTVLTPEGLQAAVCKSMLDCCVSLVFSPETEVPARIADLVIRSASTMKGVVMKSIIALAAAVALGVGMYAGTNPAGPPAKAEKTEEAKRPAEDQQLVKTDDPLPAGSTLRFGTSRFRHGILISTMTISADGKIAVAVSDRDTSVFDLETGIRLYSMGTGIEAAAISPDRRTIITKQNFSLRIRDAADGKELRKIELQRFNSYSQNEWVSVTPDGNTIAVTSQGRVVHLIDFKSGKPIRDIANDNPESSLGSGWDSVLGIALSPDGKLMASGSFTNDKGVYFARLWEVETGKELRRFMHGKQSYGIPSLALSPDAKMLATRSHDGRLRLFDVDTGKELAAFPKDGGGRRLGAVAFSPDGTTVAAAGDSIRLYEVTTRKEILRIDRKQACSIRFTDAGKTLTGAVAGSIYRWDAATGKTLTPEAGDSVVEQILVSPDGARVVTRGQDGSGHIWDGATARHLRRIPVGWQCGLAMSPDGRFLAWPVDDGSVRFTVAQDRGSIYSGSRIRLYDIAADKFVDRFPAFNGVAKDLAFTGDGKKLVTADSYGGMVRIWDVEAGKEERRFEAMPEALKKQGYHLVRTLLSPDGKIVAKTFDEDRGARLGMRERPHVVRLREVATGRELPALAGGYPIDKAFSPDGRFLVTQGVNSVCEVATGKQVAALPNNYMRAAAFSRDGRFLATTVSQGVIPVWETATWTKRTEFKGHGDETTALAFTPKGQLLSGSADTTVLAWRMWPPRVADSITLEKAWSALAERESRESFNFEGRFLRAPAETVKLFADKIKSAPALDPKRIQRLLADLGNGQFTVREAASKAIQELDEQAIPYLELTLKSAESAEIRDRVKRLLEQKRLLPLSPDQIRQIRAVMVLEQIDNSESKELLRSWTGGPAGARLTIEATAALERLSETRR